MPRAPRSRRRRTSAAAATTTSTATTQPQTRRTRTEATASASRLNTRALPRALTPSPATISPYAAPQSPSPATSNTIVSKTTAERMRCVCFHNTRVSSHQPSLTNLDHSTSLCPASPTHILWWCTVHGTHVQGNDTSTSATPQHIPSQTPTDTSNNLNGDTPPCSCATNSTGVVAVPATVRIRLREPLDGASRSTASPAALVLSSFLVHNPRIVAGRRVLELGAGTGLVGLVCLALGAQNVVLTDVADQLPLLHMALAANGHHPPRARVMQLEWGSDWQQFIAPNAIDDDDNDDIISSTNSDTVSNSIGVVNENDISRSNSSSRSSELSSDSHDGRGAELLGELPDVIVCADVVYDGADHDALFSTIAMLLAQNNVSEIQNTYNNSNSNIRSIEPSVQRGAGALPTPPEASNNTSPTTRLPPSTTPRVLMAYQERSSSRTIQPLLDKWRLDARVLPHDSVFSAALTQQLSPMDNNGNENDIRDPIAAAEQLFHFADEPLRSAQPPGLASISLVVIRPRT